MVAINKGRRNENAQPCMAKVKPTPLLIFLWKQKFRKISRNILSRWQQSFQKSSKLNRKPFGRSVRKGFISADQNVMIKVFSLTVEELIEEVMMTMLWWTQFATKLVIFGRHCKCCITIRLKWHTDWLLIIRIIFS